MTGVLVVLAVCGMLWSWRLAAVRAAEDEARRAAQSRATHPSTHVRIIGPVEP
jgi:hypothetical protein